MYMAIFFRHPPNLVSAWSTGRILLTEKGELCNRFKTIRKITANCCIIIYCDTEHVEGDLQHTLITFCIILTYVGPAK